MGETLAWYERRAKAGGVSGGKGGAVSVQHRFGGALNLNCHVHAAVIDGVFTRDDPGDRATFHAVHAPDAHALAEVIEGVYRRLVAWLRRKGLLAEYDHERAGPTAPSAMDACVSTSLSQKGLVRLDARSLAEPVPPGGDGDAAEPHRSKGKYGAESLGFNLHAAVRNRAADAPRLPVPRGATEALLEPARLFAVPERAPFEPGKARYTSGAWRIDWATLLKRVYDVDALACPCGGRLKFVEVVTEAARARELLEQLGLDTAAPPVARARSPTADFDLPPPDDW